MDSGKEFVPLRSPPAPSPFSMWPRDKPKPPATAGPYELVPSGPGPVWPPAPVIVDHSIPGIPSSPFELAALVWSQEAHDKFHRVIKLVDPHKATPEEILSLMNDKSVRLKSVATFLQIYRRSLGRVQKNKKSRPARARYFSPSELRAVGNRLPCGSIPLTMWNNPVPHTDNRVPGGSNDLGHTITSIGNRVPGGSNAPTMWNSPGPHTDNGAGTSDQ